MNNKLNQIDNNVYVECAWVAARSHKLMNDPMNTTPSKDDRASCGSDTDVIVMRLEQDWRSKVKISDANVEFNNAFIENLSDLESI